MKSYGLAGFVMLLILLGAVVHSSSQTLSPAEEARQLRNELSQLLDREAQIEIRLHELEHDLKPENIESFFAGVGSTRPEELRAMRRKKLETEKNRLQAQLSEIAQDRSRMEASILNAEARANYEAAMTSGAAPTQSRMSPLAALLIGRSHQVATITLGVIVLGLIVAIIRKRARPETR